MYEALIFEAIKYTILIVLCVAAAVLVGAVLTMKTKNFSWNRNTVRAFAVLYDLDSRGIVCFALLLIRMLFVIYLAATGGTTSIIELAAIEIITLIYAIVSGDKGSFIQLGVYLVIYAIIFMESLFLAYYTDVDNDLLVLFVIISFGVFASLYTIHQAITGYEKLITVCAKRDREKYDYDTEKVGGAESRGSEEPASKS